MVTFCSKFNMDHCKVIMMHLSSAVFNHIMEQLHSSKDTRPVTTCDTLKDGDDVYYRFGGASIASMLKGRYKTIRTCKEDKRELISQEINILHTITSKNKSHMPSYMKIRDRGFLYTPHTIVGSHYFAILNFD